MQTQDKFKLRLSGQKRKDILSTLLPYTQIGDVTQAEREQVKKQIKIGNQ